MVSIKQELNHFDRPKQSNFDGNTTSSRRAWMAVKKRFLKCMSFSCFFFLEQVVLLTQSVLLSSAVPLRTGSSTGSTNSFAASSHGRVRAVTGSTSFHSVKNSISPFHASKCSSSLNCTSDSFACELLGSCSGRSTASVLLCRRRINQAPKTTEFNDSQKLTDEKKPSHADPS